MNEVVDRILNRYALVRTLDEARVTESREKISRYIEKLAAAGEKDAHQLTVYGLAYLKDTARGSRPTLYRLLPWLGGVSQTAMALLRVGL